MSHLIETERLLLREVDPAEDAAFFVELLNTPGFIKYVGDRNVRTTEEAFEYLNSRVKLRSGHPAAGAYTVILKENQLSIGNCGLFIRPNLEIPDIGFSFLPDYEGKGYAHEACVALLNHAIQAHQLTRVCGITVSYNDRSIRLLEKLGLKFERTFFMEGDPEELCLYGMDLTNE